MKKIVIPGDFITSEKKKLGKNVYSIDNKIYSSVVGILSERSDSVSVISLNGPYIPKEGDIIILVVSSEVSTGYVLEFSSSDDTYISKNILGRKLDIGSILFAKISSIKNGNIELDNINVLPKGRLCEIPSVKVPRLIGKNDSMINLLKEYTKSKIVIGNNGWIWFDSKYPELLEKAIHMIVNNSQKTNLTENIKKYLEKNRG